MNEAKQKFHLTSLERAWILYDVGNSAFVLLVATLIPIFFNALAEGGGLSSVEYLAYWGYAASAVTVITAVLSPILGTLADTRNFKKPIFTFCVAVGVIGCCAMGMASTWLPFLLIFIFAKVGFSGSLVFYDSMLSDVTVPDRMDEVSSKGYAWGYIGSCVPFVVCLALVLGAGSIGISQMTALNLALFITAAWWLVTTLPLLRQYKQVHFVEVQEHAIRQSFARIGHTLRHLKEDRQVFWFLLAFFCYIDGVYTIIDMATAYGTALGLDTTGLLLALLVTQIVAFPSALVFGRLSGQYPSGTLIPVCIAAYAGIALFAFFLKHQWQFWVLAVVVGMFQGGIQALSRSHFAKIIPPEKSDISVPSVFLSPVSALLFPSGSSAVFPSSAAFSAASSARRSSNFPASIFLYISTTFPAGPSAINSPLCSSTTLSQYLMILPISWVTIRMVVPFLRISSILR